MRKAFRKLIIVRAVLIACSIWLVWFAWNAPGGNPRDGWSMIKVWIGASPMPGSGDRAYHIAGATSKGVAPIETSIGSDHGWVLVRRHRRGVFFPWLETRNIRVSAALMTRSSWVSGTDDPTFHEALASMRLWYAEKDTEWHRRVVYAIDMELAGEYPKDKVSIGYALLDVLAVAAHAIIVLYAYRAIRWILRHQPTPAEGAPELYERAE